MSIEMKICMTLMIISWSCMGVKSMIPVKHKKAVDIISISVLAAWFISCFFAVWA